MPIRTSRFRLSRAKYFKILLRNYVARRWWLIGALVIPCLVSVKFGRDNSSYFLAFAVLLVPAYILGLYLKHALSRENKIFFEQRRCEIDQEFLTCSLDDGSSEKLRWSHIVRVVRRSDYWLLYISGSQFIYLPDYSFEYDGDREAFARLLEGVGRAQ